MKELLDLIERFQSLKDKTGTNKVGSYWVQINFDPWSDNVEVEFGGYDVGDWSRHEHLYTTKASMLMDIEAKVQEAECIVASFEEIEEKECESSTYVTLTNWLHMPQSPKE